MNEYNLIDNDISNLSISIKNDIKNIYGFNINIPTIISVQNYLVALKSCYIHLYLFSTLIDYDIVHTDDGKWLTSSVITSDSWTFENEYCKFITSNVDNINVPLTSTTDDFDILTLRLLLSDKSDKYLLHESYQDWKGGETLSFSAKRMGVELGISVEDPKVIKVEFNDKSIRVTMYAVYEKVGIKSTTATSIGDETDYMDHAPVAKQANNYTADQIIAIIGRDLNFTHLANFIEQ